jgi:hypothetical protein
MPPKPKMAAINAITKKITTQRNIIFNFNSFYLIRKNNTNNQKTSLY